MLFHVKMTVKLPVDMDPQQAERLKAEEKEMAQRLQREGSWRHLWRIAGHYANYSLFDLPSVEALHDTPDPAAAVSLHGHRDRRALPASLVDPCRRPLRFPSHARQQQAEANAMTVKISQTADVQRFFEEASGQLNERGDPRTKALVRRILDDTAKLIEEMQVTPDEFWKAVDYLNRLGSRQEAGLLAAGLGLEHYLDLLLDAQDAEAGLTGGTPRTIEGPLYVAGAPLSDGEARMDDGRDAGTVMFLQGRVSGPDGQPLAGAIVDVWHANTQGTYSYFDSSQSEYNLRRRIRTDADGRYRARSIVPSGYGCPSDGPTQELLDRLGRHGQRPAHSLLRLGARPSPPDHPDQPGGRPLPVGRLRLCHPRWADRRPALNDDPAAARDRGVEGGRFAELDFDFQLQSSPAPAAERRSQRPRALQE